MLILIIKAVREKAFDDLFLSSPLESALMGINNKPPGALYASI